MARDPLHPNRLASLPRKEKHWNWSKEPNLLTIHRRIHREKGPAKNYPCSIEGCEKKAFDWAKKEGVEYSEDMDHYEPLCRTHHIKRDKNWIKKK